MVEAARLLGLSPAEVERLVEDQHLPGQRVGQRLLVSRDDVETRRDRRRE